METIDLFTLEYAHDGNETMYKIPQHRSLSWNPGKFIIYLVCLGTVLSFS